MPNEMQPARAQVTHESLQPRSDLGHGGCCGGVPERMHFHSELTRQPTAQQQRFAARHPQPMNVNYLFPHTPDESWPLRELSTEADISKKREIEACRRRVSE
jgi:hypothetical protein